MVRMKLLRIMEVNGQNFVKIKHAQIPKFKYEYISIRIRNVGRPMKRWTYSTHEDKISQKWAGTISADDNQILNNTDANPNFIHKEIQQQINQENNC